MKMEPTTVDTTTTEQPSVREPFTKYVKYATAMLYSASKRGQCPNDVVATIKWNGTRLSITAVEGALTSGNCRGGCGQVCVQEYHQPVNGVDLAKFGEVWDRWHLNDMRAGTPKQEEYLRTYGHGKDYEETLNKLLATDLIMDDLDGERYKYGSRWLTEEVPDEVLAYLRSLPDYNGLPDIWAR